MCYRTAGRYGHRIHGRREAECEHADFVTAGREVKDSTCPADTINLNRGTKR